MAPSRGGTVPAGPPTAGAGPSPATSAPLAPAWRGGRAGRRSACPSGPRDLPSQRQAAKLGHRSLGRTSLLVRIHGKAEARGAEGLGRGRSRPEGGDSRGMRPASSAREQEDRPVVGARSGPEDRHRGVAPKGELEPPPVVLGEGPSVHATERGTGEQGPERGPSREGEIPNGQGREPRPPRAARAGRAGPSQSAAPRARASPCRSHPGAWHPRRSRGRGRSRPRQSAEPEGGGRACGPLSVRRIRAASPTRNAAHTAIRNPPRTIAVTRNASTEMTDQTNQSRGRRDATRAQATMSSPRANPTMSATPRRLERGATMRASTQRERIRTTKAQNVHVGQKMLGPLGDTGHAPPH